MQQPEFLPVNRDEMNALGWDELDVLLITGDAYVDSHAFGTSLLGRWLVAHGYRTGIIAQPHWENTDDITRMGRPRLFAGVSAGALDSLIAHYTAFRKKRGEDAYSPGGRTGLRPNRAAIVYTGLVRQAFPGLPVVAGGIEASLRRASHYDFWSDSLRRSLVLDAKADAVLYGMGERSILALARLLETPVLHGRPGDAIASARLKGCAYAVHPDAVPADADQLPSHEAILADPALLTKATLAFERQMLHGTPALAQRSGGRAVVFEPPEPPLSTEEMDRIYALPFTRRAHPSYAEPIPAVEMLEGSVASHRGCGGGCSFCSLTIHQGRVIQSRSADSIFAEVDRMAGDPEWKGAITDIGGPSSNMWGAQCVGNREECARASCLFPKRCRYFRADQEGQVELLRRAAGRPGVNHLRVASGVRHDLAQESEAYMQALVGEFTGGQLKIAPEHISENVLRLMRKSPVKVWNSFIKSFEKMSLEAGKEQYIIPYLMSGFPGCRDEDMEELAAWLRRRGWRPQQVQCFIPSPGTVATAMFYSGQDLDGRPIHVARTDAERLRQHGILMPDAVPAPVQPATRPPRSFPSKRPGGFRQPFKRDGSSGRGDRPRSDRPRDDRPRSDRPRSDRPRDDRPRSDRPRSDRPRDDRPRSDRPRSDRPRDDRPRSDRPRSDRPRDDRPRSDRPRSDRPRDDRPRSDRPRSDRPRDDRPRSDRPRSDRPRDERPRSDRPRSDRPRGDRPERPGGSRPGFRKPDGKRRLEKAVPPPAGLAAGHDPCRCK